MSMETAERPRVARARRGADTSDAGSTLAAVGGDVVSVPTAPEAEGPKSDQWGTLGPTPITDETRRPLGRLKPKLEAGQVPAGYHCRWVNDTDKGRVRDAQEAGYSFMKDADGKPVQRVVGVKKGGGPLVAFRMMIPLHWYLKDEAEKTSNRAERRADMMRGVTERGGPGSDGRYLPTRGNAPISRIENEDLGKKG
jgi:hypothetical protein